MQVGGPPAPPPALGGSPAGPVGGRFTMPGPMGPLGPPGNVTMTGGRRGGRRRPSPSPGYLGGWATRTRRVGLIAFEILGDMTTRLALVWVLKVDVRLIPVLPWKPPKPPKPLARAASAQIRATAVPAAHASATRGSAGRDGGAAPRGVRLRESLPCHMARSSGWRHLRHRSTGP